MGNFIINLICEYYDLMGFFIKQNFKFEENQVNFALGEMNILAYHDQEKILFHIETQKNSLTLDEKIENLSKIFSMAELYYSDYINTTDLQIQRVSIVDKDELNKDDIKRFEKETNSKLFDLKEFMKHIKVEVRKYNENSQLIPESYPLLRAIQLALV